MQRTITPDNLSNQIEQTSTGPLEELLLSIDRQTDFTITSEVPTVALMALYIYSMMLLCPCGVCIIHVVVQIVMIL